MKSFDSLFLVSDSLQNETMDQIREYMKWKIEYTKENFHLPPQSIAKLNALFEDDTISLHDFSRQLESVFNQYNGLWWQSWLGIINTIENA